MNPIGSVTGQEACGCPNLYVDEGYGLATGPMCSMLPGYTSVYDALTNIAPSETPSAAAPAPVAAPTMIAPTATTTTAPAATTTTSTTTTATTTTGAQAQCYNTNNMPNSLMYGPWPIQAGMGTPFDGAVPLNPLGASVMDNVASGLDALTANIKNLVGLGNDTQTWIQEMRQRYFSAVPSTGNQVQDEANFQRWLAQIREKFGMFQQSQVTKGAAVGSFGGVGSAGLTGSGGSEGSGTTRTWLLVLLAATIALAGVWFLWSRKSAKKSAGFSTTATSADDMALFAPREDVTGASAHWRARRHTNYRGQGRGTRVPF